MNYLKIISRIFMYLCYIMHHFVLGEIIDSISWQNRLCNYSYKEVVLIKP